MTSPTKWRPPMPPEKTGDYEVGYGRPPRHTRFAKGQSGNPRGRPCGAKNFTTLLEEALNEPVTVTENGGRRKGSKRRSLVTRPGSRSATAHRGATKPPFRPGPEQRPR